MNAYLVFFILVFWSTVAIAETIQLKSGQIVQGKIISQSYDAIKVDAGVGMPVTYFLEEIADIIPDGQKIDLAPTDAQKLKNQADGLEDQSAQAIDDGDMARGLSLMVRAITMDPSPQRHMNYGSMLFGNGVSLYKGSDQIKGLEILRQAELQLRKAIEGFTPSKDQVYLSQCYFLLGEIYNNAFDDKVKAKEYYLKAIDLSDYTGAKDALSKMST